VQRDASTTAFTGAAKQFCYTLNENTSSGWVKDPDDSRASAVWEYITECEFLEVLAYMDGIEIYGDVTTGTESIALDNVYMTLGNGSFNDPITCHGNYTTVVIEY